MGRGGRGRRAGRGESPQREHGPLKNGRMWRQIGTYIDDDVRYYDRFTEIALSRFEWKNAPDSLDQRYLELALFRDGAAVVFEDEVMGLVGLRVILGGDLDVYGVPDERRAYGVGGPGGKGPGYQRALDETNSVVVFNNQLRTPTWPELWSYAQRIARLDSIIDTNVGAQRTPVLIACDESQRLTMKNVYMKWEGDEPVIMGDRSLRPESLRVLRTDAPYVADAMYELKTNYMNEVLTFLGISNVNITKKERLVTSEATQSQGFTYMMRYSPLEERRKAAEKINEMFGTNIEVEFRPDYRETTAEGVIDVGGEEPDEVPETAAEEKEGDSE